MMIVLMTISGTAGGRPVRGWVGGWQSVQGRKRGGSSKHLSAGRAALSSGLQPASPSALTPAVPLQHSDMCTSQVGRCVQNTYHLVLERIGGGPHGVVAQLREAPVICMTRQQGDRQSRGSSVARRASGRVESVRQRSSGEL